MLSIDRYLFHGLLVPFSAVLAVLAALFGGYSLAGILSDAVSGLLPFGVIAALTGLKLLIALEVLIPIALFIAVVMAFGRLQSDGEVTIMLALGMSPRMLARPVLTLALLLAALVSGLSLFARPWAYAESHAITRRAAASLNVNAMQPGTFYASHDGKQVIFLGSRESQAGARGVFIARRTADHVEVIYAEGASPAVRDAAGQRLVHLNDAHVYELYPNNPGADQSLEASGLNVDPDSALAPPPPYNPVAAPSEQLLGSPRPADVAELQWRLSTGLSTLLLALLGVAMSRGRPRQARYAKFGPAILAYSAYYLLCTMARTWVQHGEVGRVPGLWWAPAALALALALTWYLPALRRLRYRLRTRRQTPALHLRPSHDRA